ASTWTKPVARVMKSRLVNGLKYPTHRLLHNAIDHIRDPQRTLSTAAFRDPNPANVTRPELSRQQFIAQFSTNVGPVLSHLLNALSIWSRGALVSCHCLKRDVQLCAHLSHRCRHNFLLFRSRLRPRDIHRRAYAPIRRCDASLLPPRFCCPEIQS